MKRRWLFPIAAGLSTMLVASAAAQAPCSPVEAKKWEGTLAGGTNGWAGATAFEQGGCSWGAAAPLDQGDTIVWDVTGYGSLTASITSQQANAAVHRGLHGYFLNEECERGGAWGITEAGTPYAVGIPEGAHWIVIFQEYGGASTRVTMETAGRSCEDTGTHKPPKKKKKPKRP